MGRGKFKGKPTGRRQFSTPQQMLAGTFASRPRTFKKEEGEAEADMTSDVESEEESEDESEVDSERSPRCHSDRKSQFGQAKELEGT